MKIATWNVNGIRARQGQLLEWLATERPDIACLQEVKASLDQLPFELRDLDGYYAGWHGEKGYSGVGLLVAKSLVTHAAGLHASAVRLRAAGDLAPSSTSASGPVLTSSFYVPNGGKDYDAKIRFLTDMDAWAAEAQAAGRAAALLRRSQRGPHRARRASARTQAQPDRHARRRAGAHRPAALARPGRRRPHPASHRRRRSSRGGRRGAT